MAPCKRHEWYSVEYVCPLHEAVRFLWCCVDYWQRQRGDSFRDPFHIGLREYNHALVIGTEDKYKHDKTFIKKFIEIRKRRGKTINRDEG